MPPGSFTRTTTIMLLVAYTILSALLLFVTFLMSGREGMTLPLAVSYALAAGALVASIVISGRIQTGSSQSQFKISLLMALATSELATLIAFVLIGVYDASAFAPVVIGSIAVNLLFIAPRALAYWRE